ncbi:hypothetical protein [Embleya sp. NPDC001921]
MSTSTTFLHIVAVDETRRTTDYDADSAHVWVRVPAWSPARAFRTGATAFVAAAGVPAADLVDRVFVADLDVDAVPGNVGTLGEQLLWPGLCMAPRIPGQGGEAHRSPDGTGGS